jgi:hypothetical protein
VPNEPDSTHEEAKKEQSTPPRLRGEETEQPQSKHHESENGSDVAGIMIWSGEFFRWWNRDRTLNLLTFVIACTTIVYSFFSYQQWQTMQNQLESSDRPWIKVIEAIPDHPLIFHGSSGISARGDDSVNLGIKVVIQNVGKSVALKVNIRTDVIFVSMIQDAVNNPFTYPIKMQKALCSKVSVAGLPINLFPGDDNRDQTGDDHDAPVSGNTFTIPNDDSVYIMPVFVGCVDYTIGVSGKTHQSGFIYILQKRGNGRLIVGNDVAMPDLELEPFAFGGFFAN